MEQTPWRDIIKTAIVDFRFYNGTLKNYANNTNALTFDIDPTFMKSHGVNALVYDAGGKASQTWMTDISAAKELTVEFLAFLDMNHLADTDSATQTTNVITGDWNVGFANIPGTGQAFKTQFWASFNNVDFTTAGYIISQDLNGTESAISSFRGSPIHVIISAKFIAATSLEVTTYVNGVYDNDTSVDHTNHFIDTTPTNTLFDGAVSGYTSGVACPVYFLRMWDTYMEDALIFADMFAQAKKILPGAQFPVPSSGELVFYAPA